MAEDLIGGGEDDAGFAPPRGDAFAGVAKEWDRLWRVAFHATNLWAASGRNVAGYSSAARSAGSVSSSSAASLDSPSSPSSIGHPTQRQL